MMGVVNDCWNTPPDIITQVGLFLGNYHDPCPANPVYDGLTTLWQGNCFVNPPYSNPLRKKFIQYGAEQFLPDDRYLWLINFGNHKDAWALHQNASAVCIPEKRIKFLPGHPALKESSPRYDSIFILWGDPKGFAECFKDIGRVYIS